MRCILLAMLISLGLIAPASAQNTVAVAAMRDAAAVGPASGAPRPKTELALVCILRLTLKGCDRVFVGPNSGPVSEWASTWFPFYVRSARYVGRNHAGDDIWDVRLLHSEKTYVLSAPNQDGRVRWMFVLDSPPDRQCDNLVGRRILLGGHFAETCGW